MLIFWYFVHIHIPLLSTKNDSIVIIFQNLNQFQWVWSDNYIFITIRRTKNIRLLFFFFFLSLLILFLVLFGLFVCLKVLWYAKFVVIFIGFFAGAPGVIYFVFSEIVSLEGIIWFVVGNGPIYKVFVVSVFKIYWWNIISVVYLTIRGIQYRLYSLILLLQRVKYNQILEIVFHHLKQSLILLKKKS